MATRKPKLNETSGHCAICTGWYPAGARGLTLYEIKGELRIVHRNCFGPPTATELARNAREFKRLMKRKVS